MLYDYDNPPDPIRPSTSASSTPPGAPQTTSPFNIDHIGLATALAKARKSAHEGGIPIGAALVHHTTGAVIGAAHNERIQKSSPTLHAEIAALENAGRQRADIYRHSTMYTTLSPCSMCTGAILLYKVPRVVIGENSNWMGNEELLKKNGVEVVVLDDPECKELMAWYIKERPEDWNEDIGR